MALEKLSTDQKLMILAGLLVLACGLFHYYYTNPIKQEIATVNDEINLLNIKIMAAQQYVGKLSDLKKENTQINARLAALKTMLPDRKETPEVIRQTNQMAVDAGLHLTGFTPGVSVEHEYYEAWPIQLTMNGSFHTLSMFFEKVSSFSRIISIENLEVTAITENPRPDQTIQATCKANTYVYIE